MTVTAPTTPAFVVTYDGQDFAVRHEELTALDARDFRAAVGIPLAHVFRDPGALDIDLVAGLVWLVRRRVEPGLTYESVAGEFSYDAPLAFDNSGVPGLDG